MKKIRERSLRLESLEDRMLLAVTAGCEEAAAAGYAAPAETGAEIVVNSLSMTALRNAIRDANDGDTITFSVSGTINATSATTIGKNITIDGGGNITIQGAGDRPLFNITSSCSFTGLELANGATTDSSGNGGVGRVGEGVTVTLNDCIIHDNSALEGNNDSGGAFYVTGTLNMNNCSVYSNKAAYGGFAFINGQNTNATINATNCNFYGNSASGYGGVIANVGGILNLTNCSVVANSSPQGAIYDSSYFVVNGTSDPNKWSHEFYICDTTIANSIFAYNFSYSVGSNDEIIATDPAGADIYEAFGKGLYGNGVVRWNAYDKDDTFTKIACTNSLIGQAGDFFVEAPVLDENGAITNLDTIDLTINTNSVAAWAGIGANPGEYTGEGYSGDSLVVTTLDDSIDSTDGEVSLREAIAYATVAGIDGTPTITFADGLAGGTISLANGQLAASTDLNIEGAGVTVDAGGESRVLFLKNYNYQLDIEGRKFATLDLEGGLPVHSDDYDITVTINDMNFTGGAARIGRTPTGGAGIYAMQNAVLNLSNATVSDNVLYADENAWAMGACGGGGLAGIYYGKLNLDNVKVIDNTVIQTGNRNTNITLNGGGIYLGLRGYLTANESVISNNTLTSEYYQGHSDQWGYGYGYGAGIGSEGELVQLTYCEVSDNKTVGCGINQFGGGIYYYNLGDYWLEAHNTGTSPYGLVIANSKVTGNSVGDHNVENNGFCQGAGIFHSGKALLVNSLIADNTIDGGNESVNMIGYLHGAGIYNGAIKNDRAQCWDETIMDIYYCTITHNTLSCVDYTNFGTDSTTWGGGIYNFANNATGSSDRRDGGGAATLNLVGSVLFHNYIRNSGTEATSNSDALKDDNSAFSVLYSLYNNSGMAGSNYVYDGSIRWLARYKVFTDEANGDYTPWSGVNPSQALDALSADAPVPPAFISAYDVRNEPYVRVYGTAQDLGCYEYQTAPLPTFEVTVTDYTGDYDGQAHTVSLSGLEAGDVVTYSADGETYSEEVVSYTDAGTYTVYVKVARDGYQDFSGSGTVTINAVGPTEQLAAPTITTGKNVYVSYGANRHLLQWGAVDNASGYELAYSADGSDWTTIEAAETSAVVRGLTYGVDMIYRVRALGDGVTYTDSDWSASKTFNVCPMDINNDEDISGGDRTLLALSWLSEEGEDEYQFYADINGDGDVGGADRAYLSNNWLGEAGEDDLQYPPAIRADAVFAEFASADLDVDLGAF